LTNPRPINITEWSAEAACKKIIDPATGVLAEPHVRVAWFFPERNGDAPHYEAVKACRYCEVREECAEWAIHFEGYGYMGGLSPSERESIRRRRRIYLRAEGGRDHAAKPMTYKGRRELDPCGTVLRYKQHLRLSQNVTPKAWGGCGCLEAWTDEMDRRRRVKLDRKNATRRKQKEERE
jgi:hypothetical protein